MPSLDLPQCLIWFAHCPKAGGTSVEKLMVSNWGDRVGNLHWGWDLWWRRGGWRLADPPSSPQHLIWPDALDVLPRIPDVVFAITRDPLARLVSEFYWQRQGRRSTWIGKVLAHLPFHIWLRLMLRVAEHNPYAFDNHLRPQGDFIPHNARLFPLEDGLRPVADWLSDVTGHVMESSILPYALSTRGRICADAREAALVGQVFEADYRRFNYAQPTGTTTRPFLDQAVRLCAPIVAFLDRRGKL